MNKAIKIAVIVLTILYIVSPVDICPGPLDDVVVALFGLAVTRGTSLMG